MSDVLMLNALAESYAGLIRGPNIKKLFDWIEGEVGREEALNICKIGMESVKWYRTGHKEPNDETRKKMLKGLLKYDYLGTMERLADMSFDLVGAALSSTLGNIYEKAMNPDIDPDDFSKFYDLFDRLFGKYSGKAGGLVGEELNQLLFYLNQRKEKQI
jgi:hypothetical protein